MTPHLLVSRAPKLKSAIYRAVARAITGVLFIVAAPIIKKDTVV